MDYTEKFRDQRIISFCTGIRGIERGLESVMPDLKTVAYVEIEAIICANLVAQMETGNLAPAPIYTDCKTFDAKPFRNRIHGIIGGYPCQGESTAGKRKLYDDPRFLWPHFERHIKDSNPVWCFFENVTGHITGSFPYILQSLRRMGYKVEAGIFSAEEVGAPHQRKRLFILAYSNCNGARAKFGGLRETSGKIERAPQREVWQRLRDELGNGGEGRKMGDPYDEGPQRGCIKSSTIPKRWEIENGYPGESSEAWPALRGQPQYNWEEPRQIESRMGCTIDGYDFRVDLLRALGNGVVEQTAEKAFRYLMQKLFNQNETPNIQIPRQAK